MLALPLLNFQHRPPAPITPLFGAKIPFRQPVPLPEWYHVTVLSNFAKGYDKYGRRYSKAGIPESTFPNQFFLLRKEELGVGIAKNRRLLEKLGLQGDKLLVLKTRAPESALKRDHASGVGQYLPQNHIDVESVFLLDENNGLKPMEMAPVRVEDAIAQSFKVLGDTLKAWSELIPRSISVLPIALACQAACRFCFSKASVSSDFEGRIRNWDRIQQVLQQAKAAGAERAVITGGGEPTLLKKDDLIRLVRESRAHFNKVVLINNGHRLGKLNPDERLQTLLELDKAGLGVLAVSRHHHDPMINEAIMGLDTLTENVISTWRDNREQFKSLKPRFICVLQKGGVDSEKDLEEYLSWATQQGVSEVNFKELYVSTNEESKYSGYEENEFSARNQVPLKLILDFAQKHGWRKIAELPWGAPVFKGEWDGKPMQIAAYTEPSVFWERTNGVARSWNLMANGQLLASLEDNQSVIRFQ